MVKTSRILLIAGAALGLLKMLVAEDSVDVAFAMSSERVCLQEPIAVTFGIKNNLEQPIIVDLGYQRSENFQFEVESPAGKKFIIRPPLKGGFSPGGSIRVEPGRTYTDQLSLGGWFGFDTPGQYHITALLNAPVKDAHGQLVRERFMSGLVLTVDARDEQQLRNTCSRLLNEISAASSYVRAEQAAKSLALVRDPIAVPYLRDATKFWHLAPITIEGLREIADSRAADAVILLMASGDADEKALSRSALGSIEKKTTDMNLKETIRRAFQTARLRPQ
jgi:hypothetical protein